MNDANLDTEPIVDNPELEKAGTDGKAAPVKKVHISCGFVFGGR